MEEWTKTGTEQQYELNVKCLGILLRVKNSLFSQKFKKIVQSYYSPKKIGWKMKKNLPIKWPPLPISLYLSTFWDTYESSNVWLSTFHHKFSQFLTPCPPTPPPQTPPNPPSASETNTVLQGVFGDPRNSCSCTAASTRSLAKVLLNIKGNAWRSPLKGLELYLFNPKTVGWFRKSWLTSWYME